MLETIKLLFRSLYSASALKRLYIKRQASQPTLGNRNGVTLLVAMVLLGSLGAFLLHQAWSAHRPGRYLKSHARMIYLPQVNAPWSSSGFLTKNCGSERDCYRFLQNRMNFGDSTPVSFTSDIASPSQFDVGGIEKSFVTLFRLTPDPNLWGSLGLSQTLVMALPELHFRRADIYIDGEHASSFFDSRRLSLAFDPKKYVTQPPRIDLMIEVPGVSSEVFNYTADRPDLATFVTTQSDYEGFQDFLSTERTQQGDAVGWIVRVVLAVFALVLFLAVDGSPECLGLALFMGFEAFAKSLGLGWLPFSNDQFLSHFAFQMGDIFRLYFFLQLARLITKDAVPWLVWGAVLSVPYGMLRHYAPLVGWTFQNELPNYRDILVGSIGMVVCLRSAWFLKGRNLPWRQGALLLGALAAFEQVYDPLGSFLPVLAQSNVFHGIADILQPYAVYFFTISTLLNISTLENRVRQLSTAKTKVDIMERDLELGRTLQRTFLDVPALPPEFGISCHHEAARYVSGDTYFVHANPLTGRLVFLMNDVAGHGIQAALKASACQVIAQSIWQRDQGQNQDKVTLTSLLPTYEKSVSDYMLQMNKTEDLTALAGGEFDPKTGLLSLYRSNFTFPILIAPQVNIEQSDGHLGEVWAAKVLTLKNRQVTTMKIPRGSFILLLSDGYLTSSRHLFHLLQHIRRSLANKDGSLTANTLTSIILRYSAFEAVKTERDDRTLLVFQWNTQKVMSAMKASPLAGQSTKAFLDNKSKGKFGT